MAIAPSKLGRFIEPMLTTDEALLRSLRGGGAGLVRSDAPDDALIAVCRDAREKRKTALLHSMRDAGLVTSDAPDNALITIIGFARELHDKALLRNLRDAGLVRSNAPDNALIAVFRRALEEHDASYIEWDGRQVTFNSPEERVRFFLEPYLTKKGRRWAVPLKSLGLPHNDRPWWRIWG